MIYAGILGAGIGVRMHRQDLPKPFLMLGEKPIIIHTLEQFFVNPRIDKLIVVAPETWNVYAEDLISKYDSMGKEVEVIAGGANKTESISIIAEHIAKTSGITNEDILVTHDAIRPFVTQRIINENIDVAIQYGAANTVMTTNDTLIISNNGITLSDIPPKHRMFAEQTPQSFNLCKLKSILDLVIKQGVSLLQESELARFYLQHGKAVHLVRGEYSNMKIINPYDLEVANALLKERKND